MNYWERTPIGYVINALSSSETKPFTLRAFLLTVVLACLGGIIVGFLAGMEYAA